MKKRIVIWAIVIALSALGVFALGRLSNGVSPTAQEGPPPFSLSQGAMGMISGGASYEFDDSNNNYAQLTAEELVAPVQRYLAHLDNPDLVPATAREFAFAYQVEIIERSTGRHAFGLMLGKGTMQLSPKAGPNVFWNTKYGTLIAEVGGGYGMTGRLLPQESAKELTLPGVAAHQIAAKEVNQIGTGLALDSEISTFYGFYEFQVVRDGKLTGEIDVNGYTGQVWYKDWGEPQRSVLNLLSSP